MQKEHTPLPLDAAEAAALTAASWLFSNEVLRERFLALSGMSADQVRSQIQDGAFLTALLQFFLDFPPDLQALCDDTGLTGETLHRAWHTLGHSSGAIVPDFSI